MPATVQAVLAAEPIRRALADERLGLGERADDLLQEERIAVAALGQKLPERAQRAVVPEELPEQLVGGSRRERVELEVVETGPAGPEVLVAGPAFDDQQQARGRDVVEQAVEERLRLPVDPLEVLEHQHERLALGLLEEHLRERIDDPVVALARVERAKRIVRWQRVQQGDERRHRVAGPGIELAQARGDLLGHPGGRVERVELEVGAQELDDRAVRSRPLVRLRAPLEDAPRLRLRRAEEFVDEPGLADARLRADRHDLPLTDARVLEQRVQAVELRDASDESRELPRIGGPEPRARRRPADELGDFNRRAEPPDQPGAQRGDLHGAFGKAERAGRDENGAGVRHLLHAGGEVGRLAHCGVVHLGVAADLAYDDLAGVQADADPDRDALGLLDLLGVAPHGLLHPERCIAGAHRVVLVRERRAEERHDAVAHHLVHVALVAVDRFHHALEDGVEQPPGFLGVAVGEELHRAFEVGEEHGDLLALADHRGARSGSCRRGAAVCRPAALSRSSPP